jgi:hypothetical protein
MEALKDITGGAPDGIFSEVSCRVLFAQQAAIEMLESMLIKVQERRTHGRDSKGTTAG